MNRPHILPTIRPFRPSTPLRRISQTVENLAEPCVADRPRSGTLGRARSLERSRRPGSDQDHASHISLKESKVGSFSVMPLGTGAAGVNFFMQYCAA